MYACLKNGSQWGLVKMAVMKNPMVLQAPSSWQAQSKHLSIL